METVNDQVNNGIAQSINQPIQPAQKTKFEPDSKRINIKFIRDLETNFLLEEAPEAPALIKIMKIGGLQTFLRKGIVGQLVGAGGIGKTHFLTQLALAIATGTKFLDEYYINEKGYVFLGLGENSTDDIHRLLRKMSKKLFTEEQLKEAGTYLSVMSFTGQQASFMDRNGNPSGFFEDFLATLKTQEPTDGWALIILDPISRFLGADAENDNAAATHFISLLERLTLELKGKPTVLFGHHMSKANLSNTNTDQTAARGSSALTDGVRWQANLDKVTKEDNDEEYDQTKISFKVVKSNFTAITDKHILRRDEEGCLHGQPQKQNEYQSNAKPIILINKDQPDYAATLKPRTKKSHQQGRYNGR